MIEIIKQDGGGGGIESLNGLTATDQFLAVGTSGTDFAISSSVDTNTFNLPTASAINRGALSAADWSTFNGKQDALVSGTNIKTINSTSILGSGNLVVAATPSGVSGAVQFSDGSALSSDAANFFWDNANDRLGLGINAPLGILHLKTAAATTRMVIDGAAAQNKVITYRTNGVQRFGLYTDNTAESGSNVGSDFKIRAYSDAGSLLTTPLFIKRSTGNIGINTTAPTAKLEIIGSGVTSATSSLLVKNSGSTVIVRSYDSGGFATGLNALAAGANSFATGENANASGIKAAAFAESIASGNNSFAFSGGTASGIQSFAFGNGANASGIQSVALGWRNKAQANASLSTGSKANAYYQSTRTHAAVKNAGNLADGEAQWSESHFALKAALTTGATDFLLTGEANDTAANRLIPEGTNRVWNVKLSIVSVVSLITGTATGVTVGDIYMENQYLCFRKIGGISSVFSTVDKANQKNSASLATMLFDVIPNAINQALQIKVTAPTFAGGGSVTLTNSCKIEFTEVAY
jgi:hypothetical protein